MRALLGVALGALVLAGTAVAAPIVARTGETVEVEGPRAQEVADLLASFPHGAELADVNVDVVEPDAATVRCQGGIACYYSLTSTLVMPESIDGYEWQQVLAHEYGHHIASNRLNPPWHAFDWGPKRWATVEQICEKDHEGMFLGYYSDPGEAFAEEYRLLVAATLSWSAFPVIVDDGLFPWAADVQQAILEDVLHPWTGPRTWTVTRRLRAGASSTIRIETPLDGTLKAVLRSGRGTLEFNGWSGRRISTEICGDRSVQVRVRAVKAGTFRISVSAP